MTAIITTSSRPNGMAIERVAEAVEVLGYREIERNKQSVTRLQEKYNAAVLVAGNIRFELYRSGMEKPFFFHPNSSAFRLKRLLSGEKDPVIEVSQLRAGDSFLDCTVGLASDSIIASYIVGDCGSVLGIEADRDIAFITGRGLRSFPVKSEVLKEAMARVEIQHVDAIQFLKSAPDNSWDVVYIDPMFSAPISESSNFTPLRQVGVHSLLTEEWVAEALRVCRRRVVLKAHFESKDFETFGFERQIRPNTKFHFGFKEK